LKLALKKPILLQVMKVAMIMLEKMTWEEIKKLYPGEWVAIVNHTGDTSAPYGNIQGDVLFHEQDEGRFTEQLRQVTLEQTIDIRFTGNILPDNPVGPILWQISNTNS